MWILNTNFISYKELLMWLSILPRSLYQELYVILMCAKILNGKMDINWRNYVIITETGRTRNQFTGTFSYRAFCFRKCDSNFWFRACQLLNLCNNQLKMDILFDHQHKVKILKLFQTYFKPKFNERVSCTWRLLCGCTNCENVKKTHFLNFSTC